MIKKNSPGGCFCTLGYVWNNPIFQFGLPDFYSGYIVNLCSGKNGHSSFLPEDIGMSGAFPCGLDTENKKLLLQKPSGEVWSLDMDGVTELVWDTSSDISGYLISHVRYSPSWGYASVSIYIYDVMLQSVTYEIALLDVDGNFVQGPFGTPAQIVHGGGFDTFELQPNAHSPTPTGDLAHVTNREYTNDSNQFLYTRAELRINNSITSELTVVTVENSGIKQLPDFQTLLFDGGTFYIPLNRILYEGFNNEVLDIAIFTWDTGLDNIEKVIEWNELDSGFDESSLPEDSSFGNGHYDPVNELFDLVLHVQGNIFTGIRTIVRFNTDLTRNTNMVSRDEYPGPSFVHYESFVLKNG